MRDDGYIQDEASQWVADLVGARARGARRRPVRRARRQGDATGRERGVRRRVRRPRDPRAHDGRERLTRSRPPSPSLVADARRPPFATRSFDRVLVDAPCSGLGVLRRRPDAAGASQPEDVARLAALQRAARRRGRPRSSRPAACSSTACARSPRPRRSAIDEHLARAHPELEPLDPPGAPWRAHGRGALLLPQDADTDGMFVLRLRRP